MKWTILIRRENGGRFQSYVGWDHEFDSKKEAQPSLKKAKSLFCAAKLVRVKE